MASRRVPLRRTLMLGALLVACSVAAAGADAGDDWRALVMLRALAYDTHLDDRVGDEVRLVIVYADGPGTAEARRWTTAFTNVRKIKVAGRPVAVTAYKFESEAALRGTLRELHAAAVVACEGLARAIPVPALAAITRSHRVLSFSTRESDVIHGLAVGIVKGATRDEIVVNVAAAAAEGVKFDAGLLQLARSVEEAR
jgi:uncharacterized protein DUF4154